jgi:hypothetical protein
VGPLALAKGFLDRQTDLNNNFFGCFLGQSWADKMFLCTVPKAVWKIFQPGNFFFGSRDRDIMVLFEEISFKQNSMNNLGKISP